MTINPHEYQRLVTLAKKYGLVVGDLGPTYRHRYALYKPRVGTIWFRSFSMLKYYLTFLDKEMNTKGMKTNAKKNLMAQLRNEAKYD